MLFALLLTASVPSPHPPPQAIAAGFNYVALDEEFDDSTADLLRRWSLGLWYQAGRLTPDQVHVADGIATLTTQASPRLRNTMLSTWSPDGEIRRTFRFGYFEARMRWPMRNGNWANFWLESIEAAKAPWEGKWPPYCEIDVAEALPRGYQSTAHDWTGRGKESDFDRNHRHREIGYRTDQWHNYGLLWQPGRITFYFDDKLVSTFASPPICDIQSMMVNFGIQRRTGFPESADFDWIRVFD